ncbi:MAG: hypothetical protein CVU23_13355, partial [Betaproteobacteria bacterium HGW-Betaproteobacteria-17]
MKPRILTVLGATGTIGVNTLDVVARHPGRFEVFALTGATQVERMLGQCRIHRQQAVVVAVTEIHGEADLARNHVARVRVHMHATDRAAPVRLMRERDLHHLLHEVGRGKQRILA